VGKGSEILPHDNLRRQKDLKFVRAARKMDVSFPFLTPLPI
jgi:hypothetical protein